MQKLVLRVLMESGEAIISFNDNDEKCVDLAELLGFDIYDFKDSSLVEDCIVDAYNTSGIL